MSRSPRIVVLIETSTTWGSKVVRGIAQFARENGWWSIFVEPRGVNEQLRIPAGWRGDGVIARVTSRQLDWEVRSLGVPSVNVSWSRVPGSDRPQVIPDEDAVGRLAAEHSHDRGFRRFAYLRLCEIAVAPLSCVDHSPERIGYEAAALLARMMNGRVFRDAAGMSPSQYRRQFRIRGRSLG
jgi:DNA-binding LacI/PurR family transcriptional regulator